MEVCSVNIVDTSL